MTLRISPDLELPLDVVTQTLGIVAQRGAGKTYLTGVLIEELTEAGLPSVTIDPMGVYWGLRSSADGKSEGLSIVIFGGDHGDVPLGPDSGAAVAEWVATARQPCVLDISGFRKGEQRRFVCAFAEELYQRNREPLHLILDEADLWAPQRPGPDENRMLGAIEDLVRRGRARGIGLSLVTQRPAVINKDVLTQVSALVALRITGPQDRKAIEEWIRYHGDGSERNEVLSTLASMPIGTGWFWSPGWMGVLRKIGIRRRTTFDSSATPKPGAARVVPQKLAPVDLEALRGRIAETIERSKAEDPKALREQVAALKKELAEAHAEIPEHVTDRLERAARSAQTTGTELVDAARGVLAALPTFAQSQPEVVPKRARPAENKPERVDDFRPEPPTPRPAAKGEKLKLSRIDHALLSALVQHGKLSLTQAAIIAGYSPTSGSVSEAAARLRAQDFVQGSNAQLAITKIGREMVGAVRPLPTGPELAAYWTAKLNSAEGSILAQALAAHPKPISLEQAAKRAGYSPTSGSVSAAAAQLRTLELISGGNAGFTVNPRLVK